MLQDLEARSQPSRRQTPTKSPYENLRPVRYGRGGSSRLLIALLAVLVLTAAGAAGYFWLERDGMLSSLWPSAPGGDKTAPASAARAVTGESAPAAPRAVSPSASADKAAVGSAITSEAAPAHEPKRPTPAAAAAKKGVAGATSSTERKDKSSAKVSPAGPEAAPKAPGARTGAKKPDSTGAGDKAVVEKKLKPVTPQEEAERLYREAAHLVQQGRADDARAALQSALAANSAHVKARELSAGLALQTGRWREAHELLVAGMAQSPRHYPFAQLLARMHVEQGAEAQAVSVLENARAAGAHDIELLAFLATLYQRAGNHANAIKTFREAIAQRPADGRSWLGLGISLEAEKNWTEAAEAYRRALGSGVLDAKLMHYAQQRLAAIKQ
jgi:MSHA biogenesis protein MshN